MKQLLTAKYVWRTGEVDATCTDGKELKKWTHKTGDEPGAAVLPPARCASTNLWLYEGKAAKA